MKSGGEWHGSEDDMGHGMMWARGRRGWRRQGMGGVWGEVGRGMARVRGWRGAWDDVGQRKTCMAPAGNGPGGPITYVCGHVTLRHATPLRYTHAPMCRNVIYNVTYTAMPIPITLGPLLPPLLSAFHVTADTLKKTTTKESSFPPLNMC